MLIISRQQKHVTIKSISLFFLNKFPCSNRNFSDLIFGINRAKEILEDTNISSLEKNFRAEGRRKGLKRGGPWGIWWLSMIQLSEGVHWQGKEGRRWIFFLFFRFFLLFLSLDKSHYYLTNFYYTPECFNVYPKYTFFTQ